MGFPGDFIGWFTLEFPYDDLYALLHLMEENNSAETWQSFWGSPDHTVDGSEIR